MILKTRHGGNVELRAGEWGTEHLIPRPGTQWLSDYGVPVTERDAIGLPAVGHVLRSAAGIIASLPFFVYREGDLREAARESWQWALLHDRPSSECDTFEFFYDLVLSLEATQNAFVQKVRGVGSRLGRLEELYVIDPHRVTVDVDKDTGEKTYDVWVGAGNVVRGLTDREILHVRGFTPNPGGPVGVSLIQTHSNALGTMKQLQRFEGDYFKANGLPPFWFTGAANPQHAGEIVQSYNRNRAAAMSGQPGGLWGNIDVKHIPVSMSDALYAENKGLSIEDVCAIWEWPVWMVKDSGAQVTDPNARMSEFLRTKLLPRLKRIERAFAADPDLFFGQPLFGEFLTHALERADFVTRVRGYKDARQGGWVTANEIRKWENLPPREEGDELQVTPVGGAPNPGSNNEEPDAND